MLFIVFYDLLINRISKCVSILLSIEDVTTRSACVLWQQHLLGHQGESFRAHGWTWHELDHYMLCSSLEVRPSHLLQHRGQRGHVTRFCAGVSACCVQDVPSVHHEQQHVRLTLSLHKNTHYFQAGKKINTL